MLFDKTMAVFKEINRRKKAVKDRVNAQRALAADIVPFKAKMNSSLKIINMIMEQCPDAESITIKTDNSSETLVNDFIEKELSDYIVKKDENDPTFFNIKPTELNI